MTNHDKQNEVFLTKVDATLQRSLDDLSPAIKLRLQQARQAAINQSAPRARRLTVISVALAACLALVVGVYLWPVNTTGTMPHPEDLPLLSAGDEFELLEELEFYQYLEVEARSG